MSWLFNLIICLDIIYLLYFITAGLIGRFYPAFLKKKYPNAGSGEWAGTAALFIPCKGVYPSFESNIQTVLKVTDKNIRIFFIVENSDDPAFSVIEKNIKDHEQAFVVQAGTASLCSQKNYNLLKGIEASGQTDDIYVFLDSDTCFSIEKLKTLLRPLSDSSIVATCGFQWNILKKRNFGDRFMSFLVSTQWMCMNIPLFKWLWGGALAVKRTTYEELSIHDYWSKRAVDDISLTSLFKKHKKKICFVPIVINEQHQGVTSVKKAMQWYHRQYIYLKFYTYDMWLLGIFSMAFLYGQIWILPVLTAGVALFKPLLLTPVLIYTLFVLSIIIIGSGATKRPGKDNFSFISWLLLSPIFAALTLLPVLETIFTWNMKWANVLYKLNKQGIVIDIERE